MVLTGIGEVDVVWKIVSPEGTLVDSRSTTHCATRPSLADIARVEFEVFPAGRTVYRPLVSISTSIG